MDIRQLRYFIAAAEHLNFTAAARHVYITPQALSQQISELENKLGVALFIRNRHSTALTAAGDALLREAKAIITKTNEAVQITRQAASGISGRLKIGYLGFAERRFLPKLISQFRRKYAFIELTCQHLSNRAVEESLDRSDIDIGFVQVWDTAKLPSIHWKKIYSDNLCLVVPSSHPLANKIEVNFAELAKETFVFHPHSAPRGYNNLMRVCSNRGFQPNVSPVADILTVLMMIEAECGISLLPSHIPSGYASPALNLLHVSGEDMSVYVAVAWNQSNPNPSIPLFLHETEAFSDSKLI